MRITALGTGDAFSATRYSSCMLVEGHDTRLLVDCPHPIRKILRESTAGRVDVGDIDAVVMTHLHGDHASGLEGFLWFCRFALQRRARVFAHPAVAAGIWPQLQGSMAELLHVDDDNRPHHRSRLDAADLLDLVPLSLDAPVMVGGLAVECRLTIHHIPTTALRIRADNAVLGYSADTAFDPTLLHWLDLADTVVHETNYGAHTPYARLAALPAATRAKMRLIHWPDGFDADERDIAVLHDGDAFDVGPPR